MWLKSVFLSFFILFAVSTAAFVVSGLSGFSNYGSTGVLLTVIPFLLMLGYFFFFRPARTQANLLPLIVSSLAGVSIVLSGLMLTQDSWQPLLMAVTGLLGNLAYIFWYSRFGRDKSLVLEEGKLLPDFELETENGDLVTSENMRQQPSLILFYRGNWCPLCVAQIKEVAGLYQEMESRGIKVYMVSPQSHAQTAAIARRFNVSMTFLVDKNSCAAEKLQIKAKGGLPFGLQALGYDSDTVMPTVIMTDSSGSIIYVDQTDNYRVRPEPEDFLKVFDERIGISGVT